MRNNMIRHPILFAVGLILALLTAPQAAQADGEWAGTVPDQTLRVGSAFSLTLPIVTQTSANITYSIAETLPNGLSFNASSRVLSGTPTAEQTQTEYTYRGHNERDYNTLTQKFKITILAAQDITLSASLVTITESSSDSTYNVKLPNLPAGDVTVTITSSDTGAVTVSPSSLTFTTTDWNTNKQVTLTGVNDTDGFDESVTITHSASGGGYDNKSATLTAAVTDDDKGIVLTPGELIIVLSGSAKTYTIALATEPSENVTVKWTDTIGNTGYGTDKTEVTFNSTNWSTGQTVTVTPVSNNPLNYWNRRYNQIHSSTGGEYDTLTANLSVIIKDPDNAGIVVSNSSVSLTEGGGTGTYTVKLGQLPNYLNGNVTVSVVSSDTGAATVSPSSLTFGTTDWNTDKTVTVTPQNDNDGSNESLTILHTAWGGGADAETASVAVTVTDDDVGLAASDVKETTATLTITGHTAAWWYKRTAPTGDNTCHSVAANDATDDLSGLTGGTDYNYKAYSNSTCTTELTTASTDAEFSTVGLTATSVTQTAATLNLTNWSTAWWHNKTSGPGSTNCTSVSQGTNTANLSSLTPNSSYTWAVYSAANCSSSDKIADVDFSTLAIALTASNVKETTATLTITGHTAAWWYKRTAPTGDNTCHSVAANDATDDLSGLTGGTDYTYKAYSNSTCTTELTTASTDAEFSTVGLTATSVTQTAATLNLSNWSAAWWHNKTSGPGSTNCTSVSQGTNIASLSSLTSGSDYTWAVYSVANCSSSDKIADVDFSTLAIALAASNVKETTATLTITGHTAAWWYKRTAPTGDNTCHSVSANDATDDLSGLTGGTDYTYKAYSNSTCTTELTTASTDAEFSTVGLTATSVTQTAATLNLSNWSTAWWHNKTSGPGSTNCTSVSQGTNTANLSSLTPNSDYTWAVYSAANCSSSDKIADVDFSTLAIALEASDIKETTATLTIAGHTAAWWYKRTAPTGDNTCHSVAANDATDDLSGLTGGTDYTYKAYSNSTCTTELTTASTDAEFSTAGLTATSVTQTAATLNLSNWSTAWWHNKTSGPGSTNCTSVSQGTNTASLSSLTPNSSYTWAVYSAANCSSSDKIADVDFSTLAVALAASNVKETTATLTITGHTAAWWYKRTAPTGDNTCHSVSANDATDDLSGLTGGTDYTYKAYSNSTCTTELTTASTDAEFSTVGLTASAVAQNSATLNLSNWSTAWWHNKTSGPGSASCTSISQGTNTASLSNLTAGSDYTWAVYSAVNCSSSDKIADVDFSTLAVSLTASAVRETTATLTISGHTTAWWYKRTAPTGDNTCHSVAANDATDNLTGLTGGTDYTYKAYSNSTCTTELTTGSTDAEFSTVGLTANPVAQTTATLNLSNWSAAWWHNKTTGPGSANCTSVNAGTASASLSSLTVNSSYTWTAYSAANCNASDKIADVDFMTSAVSLAASDVKETAATLTITGHTAAWWYKRTAPTGDNTCHSVAANDATDDLSGLTGGTDYNYKAYSNSTCTTELTTASTDAEFSTVGLTATSVTQTAATLNLSNWSTAWWHNKTSGPGSTNCTSVSQGTNTASLSSLTPNSSYTWAVYSAANCSSSDKIADVDFSTLAIALAASNVKETTATLTITGHTAAWWYKRTAPTGDNTCHSVSANDATDDLSGLTGGTDYTYKAYSNSTCTTELTTASTDAEFSTAGLTATSVTQTTATLNLSNWSTAWWHNKTSGPGSTNCTSVSQGTNTASLSSLTPNSSYTWAVYSAANCSSSDKIADVDFSTLAVALAASNVKETTATLTITGHTAAWWYKRTAPTGDNTCHSVSANDATDDLSGLTGGTDYTYKAYSNSTCTTELTTASTDAEFSTVGLTASAVAQNSATLNLSNWSTAWWHNKTSGPGSASCTSISQGTNTASLSNLTAGSDYTWAVYSAVNCSSSDKIADVDFSTLAVSLTASAVRETTATLTISGHTTAWWYKRTAPTGDNTCHSVAANDATDNLTGLTGGTDYTYKAYSNSTCTTELTTGSTDAEFSTVGLTANPVAQNTATLNLTNWSTAWWHNKTTGPGSANCTSVNAGTTSASLSGLTVNSSYTWAVYSAANCNASNKIADVDFATSAVSLAASDVRENTATLTISGHTAAWWYKGSQSNASCVSVAQNTASANLSGLTGGTDYTYKAYSNNSCTTELTTASTDAEFSTVGLTAGPVVQNSATLNLSNWSTAWWHNKTSGPGSASCTSISQGTNTASLSSLTAGSDYTWAVYSAANCNSSDKIADVNFTTSAVSLTASAVKETGATLTISGHTAAWWYKRNSPTGDNTCHSVAANNATDNLSGLTGGTDYTYKAYSNSTCTTELTTDSTDAEFSTVGLTANPVASNTATLNLTNWSAVWWHNKTSGPGSVSCTSVTQSTNTASLSNLTTGSDYTWAVYSAANCNSSDKIADVNFTTSAVSLTASAVKETGATLTISGHTTAWWYKRTAPTGDNTCHSVSANDATDDLSGLTGDTDYTYKAYSNSTCITELTTDSTDAEFSTVGLTASTVAQNTATLNLANWSAAWWYNKTSGPGSASCTSVNAGTASANLSGLTAGSSYTWTVYSAANCNASDKIADVDIRTTIPLQLVASLTATYTPPASVRLSISNHTGNWWYRANTAPHTSCSSNPVTGITKDLTDVSGNTSYVYRAYSDSTCSTEIAVASSFLTKPGKPATLAVRIARGSGKVILSSSVSGGGTLTKWQFQQKVINGNFGSWINIPSTSTSLRHTVTGLTVGTDYQFRVRAVNSAGDGTMSDTSTTISAVELILLRPAAWLAHFGSAASGSATQMIADRIDQSTPRGSSVTIAGQPVNLVDQPIGPLAGNYGTAFVRRHDEPAGFIDSDNRPKDDSYRGMSDNEIIAGSSFYLDSSDREKVPSEGGWSLWGSGTLSSFESGGYDRSDGNLSMVMVGTDYESNDFLLGLGLSHARGDGRFNDDGSVEVDSTLTGVHPYLRYAVSDRLSVWGTLGFGDGETELVTPGDSEKAESDFRMRTGAVGAITDLESIGRTDLTVRSDYLVTRIDSDRTEAVDAASVRSSRFRLMLGAARDYQMKGGIFRPSVEVVLRHDRGDANEGTGVGVRGNFRFTYPARRLTLQLDARSLVTHEEANAEEWGVSGLIRIDPDELGHGFSLSIQPKVGAEVDSAQQLWETREISNLTDTDNRNPLFRISADVGYGMGALGGLLTLYTGVTEAGGENQIHRLGGRYTRSSGFSSNLELFNDNDSKGGITLQGSMNW